MQRPEPATESCSGRGRCAGLRAMQEAAAACSAPAARRSPRRARRPANDAPAPVAASAEPDQEERIRETVERLPWDVEPEMKQRFVDYLITHRGYKPPYELSQQRLRRRYLQFLKQLEYPARRRGRPEVPKPRTGMILRQAQGGTTTAAPETAPTVWREIKSAEITALSRAARRRDGQRVRIAASRLCSQRGPQPRSRSETVSGPADLAAQKMDTAARRKKLKEEWKAAGRQDAEGFKRGDGRFRGLFAAEDLEEGDKLAYVGRVIWMGALKKADPSTFRPNVTPKEEPYILEDRPTRPSEWPKLTGKRRYLRRFIVPSKRARPLASYANHAFSDSRIAEMRTKAADLGLDLTARANAEFEDSTLLDDHFGQFPSLKMLRDIKQGEEIYVDYGTEWAFLMGAQ